MKISIKEMDFDDMLDDLLDDMEKEKENEKTKAQSKEEKLLDSLLDDIIPISKEDKNKEVKGRINMYYILQF